jgi:hypothetical protein
MDKPLPLCAKASCFQDFLACTFGFQIKPVQYYGIEIQNTGHAQSTRMLQFISMHDIIRCRISFHYQVLVQILPNPRSWRCKKNNWEVNAHKDEGAHEVSVNSLRKPAVSVLSLFIYIFKAHGYKAPTEAGAVVTVPRPRATIQRLSSFPATSVGAEHVRDGSSWKSFSASMFMT